MPTNTPQRVSLTQALHDHLDRADRSQGRAYPQTDGDTKFACDMEDSPYDCPWCDAVEWPEGNPLDMA